MNPRRLTDFLRSKFGLFLIFVIVLFTGLWIYGRNRSEAAAAAKHATAQKKIELGQVRIPLNQGLEDSLPQQAKPTAKGEGDAPADGIVPFRPPAALAAPVARAAPIKREESKPTPTPVSKPKKIRYASLLAVYDPPSQAAAKPKADVPERFIPFGTLLKCKLVNTVDSMNVETPVIALLLEDVCQNGRTVIPANTLVHGAARPGRIRDRLTATGSWRFVWQDGRELPFTGLALDREYAREIDGYGVTDGSSGIRGRVLASDDLQELKLLAASALSGFARGTQDRSRSALGTTITGSVSNGVREGVADVFELYAQRTLQQIEEQGYFVRAAAGKEFYVYVTESVDPAKAVAAGVKPSTENQAPPAAVDRTLTPTQG